MRPSPYQITAFTHAAREKSFSKAAAVLGVTQSSITQHVAKLERLMGTQLLLRRREGLELTKAGQDLFAVSDRLRTLEQLIAEKIDDYSELSAGNLRIIANAPRPALPAIARYGALYPQVQIEFSLAGWTMAMQKLREREVEIAVIVSPERSDDLFIRDIGISRYKAFVRRDHPIAKRKKICLQDLADEVLILPEDGSLTQKLISAKARKLGITFSRLIKTTSFPVVKEAILHGVGIGLMLEDGQFPSNHLVALEVEEMNEAHSLCVVTPADKRDLRLVKSFFNVVVDASYDNAERT